jgi:hypothetical protein
MNDFDKNWLLPVKAQGFPSRQTNSAAYKLLGRLARPSSSDPCIGGGECFSRRHLAEE